MDDLRALRSLARRLGVYTRYTDGLGKPVRVSPDTLVHVCAAVGEPISRPADAVEALRAHDAARAAGQPPPVVVVWDGQSILLEGPANVELRLESGEVVPIDTVPLPFGYHRLTTAIDGKVESCTIISAPRQAWRRPGSQRSWGVGTQLAALRSARSRSVADLADLESLCGWVQAQGGDLVTVLPLLPTFNTGFPEPSPYSPVSRLFWSELILDLGEAHRPTPAPATLDVTRADAEVRAALSAHRSPLTPHPPDSELARYAQFRGASARLGRNWRVWPDRARAGVLEPDQVDAEEERFHLVAQTMARNQLHGLAARLDQSGIRLGLDLAVGVHPDGYDPWSRQHLFAGGMSVGAPPDHGFPSGQDWGFSPVLPEASRREGHRYLAASIAHQAEIAGVLRVDHIMAWTRLYCIPHGMGLHQGTYVSYPAEELFAILTLESHRNRCEVVGENLGNVPARIKAALPRHRIWGMYLAQFQDATKEDLIPPGHSDVALVGTHDTPTFAGWISGNDIGERVRYGLLAAESVPVVQEARAWAAQWLARRLDCSVTEPRAFLEALLEWLGRSESPLVIPWLEDLWLEADGVNLPGTRSSERPNWQRPMARLMEEIFADQEIGELLRRLNHARNAPDSRIPGSPDALSPAP